MQRQHRQVRGEPLRLGRPVRDQAGRAHDQAWAGPAGRRSSRSSGAPASAPSCRGPCRRPARRQDRPIPGTAASRHLAPGRAARWPGSPTEQSLSGCRRLAATSGQARAAPRRRARSGRMRSSRSASSAASSRLKPMLASIGIDPAAGPKLQQRLQRRTDARHRQRQQAAVQQRQDERLVVRTLGQHARLRARDQTDQGGNQIDLLAIHQSRRDAAPASRCRSPRSVRPRSRRRRTATWTGKLSSISTRPAGVAQSRHLLRDELQPAGMVPHSRSAKSSVWACW